MTDAIALVSPGLLSLLSNTTSTTCPAIHSCRTLTQIIVPAVYALVAANYLSVHKNVPRANLPWHWQVLVAGKIFIVALMFPDWIFVWALRSFIVAHRTRKELEGARAQAQIAWGHYPPDAPAACKSLQARYAGISDRIGWLQGNAASTSDTQTAQVVIHINSLFHRH